MHTNLILELFNSSWMATSTTSDKKENNKTRQTRTTTSTNETIHSYFMWCQSHLMKSTIKNVLSMSQILITQKKCNLHSITQRKPIHHFNCLWDTFQVGISVIANSCSCIFPFTPFVRTVFLWWKMIFLNNLLHLPIFPEYMFRHSSPWL